MSSRFRIVARFALALWSAAAAQNAWAADADPTESRAAFNRLYQQVLADPTNVELNLRYAEMAAKRGDLEAAIGALERLLVSQPDQREVQLRVGLLYARLKSYDMAKAYLQPLVTAEDVHGGKKKTQRFDLVVLATGIVPQTDGLPKEFVLDEFRFLSAPEGSAGLYGAGCAHRPEEVSAAVQDATGVALKALQCVARSSQHG